MKSLKRLLLAAEALTLFGVALWALGFQVTLPHRLPTPADERAVRGTLDANARNEDVVLLFPWWTERARLFLPENLPVVGYLGSEADPLFDHPRIWVLAQPDLPRAPTNPFAAAFLPHRVQIGQTLRVGSYALSLYENGLYAPVLFRATAALGSAKVYLEGPEGDRVLCAFDGVSHRCPGQGELRLTTEWHEVLFAARRCLSLRGAGARGRWVIEFPNVPPGRWMLEAGHIGPTLFPASLTVHAAATQEPILKLALQPKTEALGRDSAEVSANVASKGALLFITSEGSELQTLCLELSSRGRKSEALP